jgi:hypothetical protein
MDHDKVVSQNRAALRATIDFAEKQLGALAWEPAAGSEGAAELSNTETRYDRSPWGETPPRTAYAAAKLIMLGVVDDLKSLERLLVDPVPVIGPTVIARSARSPRELGGSWSQESVRDAGCAGSLWRA